MSASAPHQLGITGERVAERYLRQRGYTVLERNYRSGRREIDLIVARGGLIAFVEVKTRAGAGFGHPLEAITPRKRREIERVARAWQARNGKPGTVYRFDAVGVTLTGDAPPRIDHVIDAWRLGD